jgi:hypothetical protein
MPTIQIEANLSFEQLLNVARQMSRQELAQFADRVLLLRAQREARVLPNAEAELLLKINHPVPAALQGRYEELLKRRDARTLSAAEHEELLQLTDQVELLEAERVKHLIELAQVRQVSLDDVMKQLGLEAYA